MMKMKISREIIKTDILKLKNTIIKLQITREFHEWTQTG
jgi:hypothetical protein